MTERLIYEQWGKDSHRKDSRMNHTHFMEVVPLLVYRVRGAQKRAEDSEGVLRQEEREGVQKRKATVHRRNRSVVVVVVDELR